MSITRFPSSEHELPSFAFVLADKANKPKATNFIVKKLENFGHLIV